MREDFVCQVDFGYKIWVTLPIIVRSMYSSQE